MVAFLGNNPKGDAFDFAKFKVGGGKMASPDLGIKGKKTEVNGGGGQIKNINQTINKLVEKIEINVNKASDIDLRRLKEDILKTLLDVSNDFNYQ